MIGLADRIADLWDSSLASPTPMTFLMHWSFKTGYHEIAAKKFLATGAPFPECNSWTVSYTHLRAHETPEHLVCRLLHRLPRLNGVVPTASDHMVDLI